MAHGSFIQVEEEDDAKQEQDVVVSRHHVLWRQDKMKGDDVHPPDFLECSPRQPSVTLWASTCATLEALEREHCKGQGDRAARCQARASPNSLKS